MNLHLLYRQDLEQKRHHLLMGEARSVQLCEVHQSRSQDQSEDFELVEGFHTMEKSCQVEHISIVLAHHQTKIDSYVKENTSNESTRRM